MAVVVLRQAKAVDQAVYDTLISKLSAALKTAKGFKGHFAGPVSGGWQIVEVWDTEEDEQRWFDESVRPELPPKTNPSITVVTVHNAVFP